MRHKPNRVDRMLDTVSEVLGPLAIPVILILVTILLADWAWS